jgi:hypothetical protein
MRRSSEAGRTVRRDFAVGTDSGIGTTLLAVGVGSVSVAGDSLKGVARGSGGWGIALMAGLTARSRQPSQTTTPS